jgi:hypothetical protein
MSTDSKFGMVIGVVVVLAVAIIYFPKTTPSDRTTAVVPSLPAVSRGMDTVQLAR